MPLSSMFEPHLTEVGQLACGYVDGVLCADVIASGLQEGLEYDMFFEGMVRMLTSSRSRAGALLLDKTVMTAWSSTVVDVAG
jgi:hypothetical protein